MKRIVIALSVVLIVGVLVIGLCAGCKGKTKTDEIVSVICPVMKYDIPDVTKAAGKSVYKGKTYYFCCPMCKPKFNANPEKYTGK